MKTISGYFLTSVLGWKIRGEFPAFKKCIVIFAPHTSYFDAFYGKLFLNEIGSKHTILSKKELFPFSNEYCNEFVRFYSGSWC